MMLFHARTLAILAIAACPAWAGSFVYSSLAAWQASSPGSTATLDFESASPAYYTGFSYSPYSFSANGNLYVLPGAAAGTGSGRYLTTVSSPVLDLSLGTGVFGIAFNLGNNSAGAAPASIRATDINGVQYFTSSVTTSAPAGPAIFWGLRTDVQLVSVRITFTAILPQLDNVRYSNTALPPQAPSIPEPETWVLIVTGLVLLMLKRRPTAKSAKSSTRDG